MQDLFDKHLPLKPMPSELADRLTQQVLAAVATTLPAVPRPDVPTLPAQATPPLHFSAEQPDDQELYALFQKHLPLQPFPPELAARMQQHVLATLTTSATDPINTPATRALPATNLSSVGQSPTVAHALGVRWSSWLARLRQLFGGTPSLTLAGAASALLALLVFLGLSSIPGVAVPTTRRNTGVWRVLPNYRAWPRSAPGPGHRHRGPGRYSKIKRANRNRRGWPNRLLGWPRAID